MTTNILAETFVTKSEWNAELELLSLWLLIPLGRDMKKLNVSGFYKLGQLIADSYKTFISVANDMPDRVRALHNLKDLLEFFLDQSVDTNWKASRDRAKELIAFISPRVGSSPGELLCMPFEAGYEARVYNLKKAFEDTFFSEAIDSNVFAVSQKGTHSTLDLMERATDNLSLEIRSRLTPEAKFDFCEAGRCLALDCHTAAGLHTLRAVESMIYVYLKKLSKQSSFKRQDRSWGAYIRLLTKYNADPKVISFLQHMKDHYRNPLMHPEQTLDGDAAFSLFNASISALTQLDAAIEAIP
jgi:hypothetical protein